MRILKRLFSILLLLALLLLNTSAGYIVTVDNPYVGGTAYKYQMHTHSTFSDGLSTPAQLSAIYLSQGYDILSITDHTYMEPAITTGYAIPGIIEIDGFEQAILVDSVGMHLLVTGPTMNTTAANINLLIDTYIASDAISSIAHPNYTLATVSNSMINYISENPMFIEVYNDGVGFADDKWQVANNITSDRRAWGVAVDDFHGTAAMTTIYNKGFNVVFAPTLTETAILDSMRTGNFYPSMGPMLTISQFGSSITVSSENATGIRWIGPNGVVYQTDNSTSSTYNFMGIEGWAYAEVLDSSKNQYAWTQPFWTYTTVANATLVENIVNNVLPTVFISVLLVGTVGLMYRVNFNLAVIIVCSIFIVIGLALLPLIHI